MRPLRTYWDAVTGWTVDTPVALTGPQLVRVVAFVKRAQTGRLADRPREVREQMVSALDALTPQTLHQNLLGSKAEATLYTEPNHG